MTRLLPLLSLSALLLALPAAAARAPAPPEWLLGDWVLNQERTQALQTKKKNTSGGLNPSRATISVGGMPIPMPGASAAPAAGTPQDPRVLRCAELAVASETKGLRFTFVGVGEELMVPGDNRGRVTKWNKRKLTSNYETTSRKVKRSYELQEDGSLLVTVRIKPKQAAAIVQKRLFERPVERVLEEPVEEPVEDTVEKPAA